MQRNRNAQTRLSGKKPRSSGGGANREERQRYRQALAERFGARNRKASKKAVSLKQVFDIAKRFENDTKKLNLLGSLFCEVYAREAFSDEVKQFMEDHIFTKKTAESTKKLADRWRALGVNWEDDTLHLFKPSRKQIRSLHALDPKKALKAIEAARVQFVTAAGIIQKLTFSSGSLARHPNTSNILRLHFLGFEKRVLDSLNNLDYHLTMRAGM